MDSLAEKFMDEVSVALTPGKWMVDLIPARMFVLV
jgi:hypothetical protein